MLAAPARARRKCVPTGPYVCECAGPDEDDVDGQICMLLGVLEQRLQRSPSWAHALRTMQESPMWHRGGVVAMKSTVPGETAGQGLFVDVLLGRDCPAFQILALLGRKGARLERGFRYNDNGTFILWDTSDEFEAGWANTCYASDTDEGGEPCRTNAVFRTLPFSMPDHGHDSAIVLVSTREIPMMAEIFAEYPQDFVARRFSRDEVGLPALS